jgi:hypothetical protein
MSGFGESARQEQEREGERERERGREGERETRARVLARQMAIVRPGMFPKFTVEFTAPCKE